MAVHVVTQGECLSSIAAQYGMTSWRDLYEHPDNADLKKKRRNPNVLAPGDEVNVPDPPKRWETRPTQEKHTFVVPVAKVELRVVLRDWRGKALAGKRFVVRVDERDVDGTTDGDGMVRARIPAQASRATLRVWLTDDPQPEIDRELSLGHIDPIDTISGVRARLRNLGYACPLSDEAPEDIDDPTLTAVRRFRAKNDLPEVPVPGASTDDDSDPSSDPPNVDEYAEKLMDDAFRQKLLAAYDGES
jgi:N-acetylmuramoyl-L-alanine amidase